MVDDGATFINDGTITVTGTDNGLGSAVVSRGIWGTNENTTIINSGEINVLRDKSNPNTVYGTGIYTKGTVYNYGTINLTDTGISRIYTSGAEDGTYGGGIVADGPDARVYNSGTISLNNVAYLLNYGNASV